MLERYIGESPFDQPESGCARPMSAERGGAVNAKDNPSATGDGTRKRDPTDRQPVFAHQLPDEGLFLHVTPKDDAIEHELTSGCICGPTVERGERGYVILHHSLDGREVKS